MLYYFTQEADKWHVYYNDKLMNITQCTNYTSPRHQHHYAIGCAKRNNTEIIRNKLAGNMSNSYDSWKELLNIDPASKSISNKIDHADQSRLQNVAY